MAALDWSQCPAVESIPGKVSGAWREQINAVLHFCGHQPSNTPPSPMTAQELTAR